MTKLAHDPLVPQASHATDVDAESAKMQRRSTSVVKWKFEAKGGPRNSGVWRGENRSDTSRYREDFQRGQAPEGPASLMRTSTSSH
jgi:hypothetical protein